METTVYMYARVPDGEPRLRVGGSLRPTEEALDVIRQNARNLYDPEMATETLKEKADSLPQDRDPEDFSGSYVLMGLARFDKNTGTVTFEDRDYEFVWGEMSLAGRDPTQCEKGYFESLETYYPPSEEKPTGW